MKIALLYNNGAMSNIKEAYFYEGSPLKSSKPLMANIFKNRAKKKTPIKEIREYVENDLIPALENANVSTLLIADADYFKVITGSKSAEPFLGYKLDSLFGDFDCFYVPNYLAMFSNPEDTKDKIAYAFEYLQSHIDGRYTEPGTNIIKHAWFPKTTEEIKEALNILLHKGMDLACDIEAYSLKHVEAGIGSIAFSWDKDGGIAFPVDFITNHEPNLEVRELLRQFFIQFEHKITFHGITYDNNVLVYQLFMDHITDWEGLNNGMSILFKNWDCTKLMAYLANNSCARPDNGLKSLAQEFAGNWAVESEEIKDIKLLKLDDLLKYNLIDTMSTVFVKEKYEPIMDADNQREIYEDIFKPAAIDIVHMQLVGMPINMKKVAKARDNLQSVKDDCFLVFDSNIYVKQLVDKLNEDWVEMKNNTLKVKRVSLADANEVFNPNSNPQLQMLLFEIMNLPIIDYTKSGLPGTGGKVLKELIKNADEVLDKDTFELLTALAEYKALEKILSSFIPAMEKADACPNGWHYLHGFFNLGGTVSGRLSSNNPNMQNIPANGKLAKVIKDCFEAPPGWLFIGLDYASLEDRISALTTKDKNKLKVYTEGFDGHCLRAYTYFGHLMPDIDPNNVESINSIEHKYPALRQLSKTPTFLLTYKGTHIGLAKKCGFSIEEAKSIEASYNELYKESIRWVDDQIDQATIDGYVTGAFGLRIRTPLLQRVILHTSSTPYSAIAESRTAGNALGQSWCLLNNRSSSEFMAKVRTHKKWRDLILPCAQIHDAFYLMVPDDLDAISYVNKHLVDAVNWNDHPDIYHPDVGLGGELSVFYPTWNDELVLPNGLFGEDLRKHLEGLSNE